MKKIIVLILFLTSYSVQAATYAYEIVLLKRVKDSNNNVIGIHIQVKCTKDSTTIFKNRLIRDSVILQNIANDQNVLKAQVIDLCADGKIDLDHPAASTTLTQSQSEINSIVINPSVVDQVAQTK